MQFLSKFISALDGPFVVADVTGRITSHNASFAAHCLRENASLVGLDLSEVWEPAYRDELNAYLVQLASLDLQKAPKPFNGASMIAKPVHADGQWWVLCQGTAPRAEDPLLHFFLEHVDHGFWDYDTLSGEFTVSDAWRKMRGFDLDDDINNLDRDWMEDVHPFDRDDLKSQVEKQISGDNQSFTTQYRRMHLKTGEWVWLYCRATVIAEDANGRPLRIVGTDTDITEVKNGENLLTHLDNKIDLAIGVAGIGVFEFDLSTARVYWDDRLLAIYGLPPGENERTGDEWATFLHPEDAKATIAYADKCAQTLTDIRHDFRIIRRNNEVRHLRTMARFVKISEREIKLIGVNIDVTDDVLRTKELENTRKQLEFESRHDVLTGLANRRLLDETLAEHTDGDQDFCVMHMDLDYFKDINDTFGHAAGDAVLVHVANTLRWTLDEANLICRYGGDEFAVLFAPSPCEDRVHTLAQSVIEAFEHPFIYEGQACAFGVSIGSAVGRAKETVFSHADIALYAAKNAGRSRHRAYSARTGALAVSHIRRRQDLVDAISESKIECWYQPQFDATTRQFVSAEALARLRVGPNEHWSPDDFLPLAEQTGLLSDIEEFVFQRVLSDQDQWAQAGLVYPSISVNISQHRLLEHALPKRVARQIKGHHLISLEVLETAFLDEPGTPEHATIMALRDMGFPIELDDFGSGHASVVALAAIQPDKIKIDRRLTKNIAHSPTAAEILRALATIARAHKSDIILEGIENEEQLMATKEIDCDVLQGYALSPPLSASDFALMLEGRTRHRVGAP